MKKFYWGKIGHGGGGHTPFVNLAQEARPPGVVGSGHCPVGKLQTQKDSLVQIHIHNTL